MIKAKRQQVHERIARVARGRVPRDRPVAARAAGPPLLGGRAGRRGRSPTGGRPAAARRPGRPTPRPIGHFTRGLEQVAHPPRVARPRRGRAGLPGPASRSRCSPPGATPSPELEAVHARARELCRADRRHRPPCSTIIWGMWALRLLRDEMDTAIDLAGQLLDLAEARERPGPDARSLVLAGDHPVLPGRLPRVPRRLRPLRGAGGRRSSAGPTPGTWARTPG